MMASSWLKVGALLAVAWGSWWVTATWYEKQLAEARAEAESFWRALERAEATKTIEVMDDYFAKVREDADRTMAERDDARRLLERLRSATGTRDAESAANAVKSLREENARLRGLVERSVVLLQRGREGYRDAARNNDALIELKGED